MRLYQNRFNLSLYVAEDPRNKDRLVIMTTTPDGAAAPVAEFTPPPSNKRGKKLNEDQVRAIRVHFKDLEHKNPDYVRMAEYTSCAEIYEVSWWAIYDIVAGRTYKHIVV